MTKLPLTGVRILELAEVWAGPMGVTYLADLGAEVIKIESFPRPASPRPNTPELTPPPKGPKPIRSMAYGAATYDTANRNKYGVTLNLGTPRGVEALRELTKASDVVIEAYSAGTLQKLGVDYPALKAVNPDLIMVSMPGYGSEGPYKGYVSLGTTLDAYCGHHGLRGYPDADPSHTIMVVIADAIAAVTMASAVISALHYRNRTGKGQWIDLSQAEAFMPHLPTPLMDYVMNQRLHPVLGNRDPTMAPHGCYPCRGDDAWAVIAVTSDEEWRSLCSAVGHEEWASDKRFADVGSRHQHHDELDAIIQEWTLQHDKQEVMRLLQEAGVPAGAVLDEVEVYDDPHLNARGFFREITHSIYGQHRYLGLVWRSEKSPSPARIPANSLGQHNEDVYGQLLGMKAAELEAMERDGIIGREYPTDTE